jgi:hypothetical protein
MRCLYQCPAVETWRLPLPVVLSTCTFHIGEQVVGPSTVKSQAAGTAYVTNHWTRADRSAQTITSDTSLLLCSAHNQREPMNRECNCQILHRSIPTAFKYLRCASSAVCSLLPSLKLLANNPGAPDGWQYSNPRSTTNQERVATLWQVLLYMNRVVLCGLLQRRWCCGGFVSQINSCAKSRRPLHACYIPPPAGIPASQRITGSWCASLQHASTIATSCSCT